MTWTPNGEVVDLNIVGSSKFGRYKKISDEHTYNMFVTDNWLVNYAGFRHVLNIAPSGVGRGVFHSTRGNFILCVIGSGVYRISPALSVAFVGSIAGGASQVSMDENLNGQIAIADGANIYIYHWPTNSSLTVQALGVSSLVPSYVTYHNTFFLIGNSNSTADGAKWYVYIYDTDTTIKLNTVGFELALENKPDTALAPVRLPGKGNNIVVFGKTVGAYFTQQGGLQNYVRHSSSNIDYGVVSVNTIAASDEIVCWLAQNENNAPVIMVTTGGSPQRISTDGIDFFLSRINVPEDSTAFFYRQDGHLFYQLTFYNESDNKTITYDFNTQSFFELIDENRNYFPIRQLVYFNNKIYGISLNDANLYELSSTITQFEYEEATYDIPRTRIVKSIRKKNSQRYRGNVATVWMEQGEEPEFMELNLGVTCSDVLVTEPGDSIIVTEDDKYILGEGGSCSVYRPRVDVRISKTGGANFSNIVGYDLNPLAHYRNQFRLRGIGQANETIFQFDFWTRSRVIAGEGTLEVY